MKENTTWQTVYEQLQEFLNECIKLWWKSKLFFSEVKEVYCTKYWLESEYWSTFYMSYHDLFSKDSGIMEFVEWERKYMEYIYTKDMDMNYKYICSKEQWYYHAMIMWPMTTEEKIQYFLANAKLPTKSE